MEQKEESIRTVILCGGKGTRLADYTETMPKPLLPVGQYPILWHIMKSYSARNFNDFVVCLGYKGEMIRNYFCDHDKVFSDVLLQTKTQSRTGLRNEDWNIRLVNTGAESKTALRLWRVKNYLQEKKYFMLTYGDGVSDVDMNRVLDFHKSFNNKILGTVTLAHPHSRYGMAEVEENGLVGSFVEKPVLKQSWTNIGFMVFNREIFQYPLLKENLMIEDILENLSKEKLLAGYRHEGFFHSMDTQRDYGSLNELWDSGSAPWKVWEEE